MAAARGGGLSLPDVFAASVAADLAQKTLLHPVDTVKTRLQYMRVHVTQSPRPSMWQTWPLIGDLAVLRAQFTGPSANNFALGSLYRGLVPALVGVVPTALVYMPTYELSLIHI